VIRISEALRQPPTSDPTHASARKHPLSWPCDVDSGSEASGGSCALSSDENRSASKNQVHDADDTNDTNCDAEPACSGVGRRVGPVPR
jgi:hypothetical protein